MGIKFSNLVTLENTTNVIGSKKLADFEANPRSLTLQNN